MGTINYGTSNYITLGIQPQSIYDLERDPDFMNELREGYNLTEDEDPTSAIYDYISIVEDGDRANLKSILNKYNFYYFHTQSKTDIMKVFIWTLTTIFLYFLMIMLKRWKPKKK